MPSRLPVLAAVAFALTCSAAGAQEAAPLTLDAALALAAREHPRLLELDRRADEAAGRKTQAALYPRPTIEAGYLEGSDNSSKTMIDLGQPIEIGGRRGSRIRQTGVEADAVAAERAERWNMIQADLRQAFAQTAWSEANARLAAAAAEAAAEDLRQAESLRAAGVLAETAVVPLRQRAASLTAEAAAAKALAEEAPRRVHAALGRPPTQAVARVTGMLEAVRPPAGSPAKLAALMLQRNPALETAQAKIRIAQAAEEMARANRWPNLMVSSKHEAMESGGATERLTGVGVGVDLPLWNRNQGETRAAAAARDAAAKSDEAVRTELYGELSRLLAEYDSAAAAAGEQRTRILPEARKQRELTRSKFEAGLISRREDLASEQEWLKAQSEAVRVDYTEVSAAIQLARILGFPAP